MVVCLPRNSTRPIFINSGQAVTFPPELNITRAGHHRDHRGRQGVPRASRRSGRAALGENCLVLPFYWHIHNKMLISTWRSAQSVPWPRTARPDRSWFSAAWRGNRKTRYDRASQLRDPVGGGRGAARGSLAHNRQVNNAKATLRLMQVPARSRTAHGKQLSPVHIGGLRNLN